MVQPKQKGSETTVAQQQKKKAVWMQTVPYMILIVAAGLLVWRSFYSFCASDESFYLAMTHRFWLGQAPAVEEWNTAQLYALLLLPFYSLYRAVMGGTQGIYLAARILYVVLAFVTSLALYQGLKRENPLGALAASLLVLFYVKANIGGMSYYGVCFLCVVWTLLLLYGWKPGRSNKVRAFFAGVLFALAVVCMPFLAVCSLAVVPFLFAKRLRGFRAAAWWFVGGILAAAVVYCSVLFSRVGLGDLLTHVPYVMADPDSHELNLLYLLLRYFANPVYQFLYTLPLWGGAGAVTLWCLWRKKAISPKLRFWLLTMAGAALVGNLLLSYEILGKAHTALCLFAAQCWLLTPKEKRPWKALWWFVVPGLVFALIWQMSSNTQFSGMTVGFAVSAIGAALMVPACLEAAELPQGFCVAVLCAALAGPVLMSGWQRVALVYRDAPLSQCTARLEQGPGQGLYTSPAHKEEYDQVYADILSLGHSEKPLFISSLLPWGYLCTDRPVGAPSTWRILLDGAQLEEYYQVNPQNFPVDVLVLAPQIGNYVSTIQPEQNDAPNQNVEESAFLDQLKEKGYTTHSVKSGVVYTAP